MYGTLIFIVVASFLALLVLNIYFRVKVMGVYKRLVSNRVDFEVKQLLDKKRLEAEVVPKYPKHKEDILEFAMYITPAVRDIV